MYVIHTQDRGRPTASNGSFEARRHEGRQPTGRRPIHPLGLGLVVAGVLSVPLVVVSAILGRLPLSGTLLGGALLFAVTWIASTVRSGARSA